jgi:hypothetical protein
VKRKIAWIVLLSLLVCVCSAAAISAAGGWLYFARSQPAPIQKELFPGVTYLREVRTSPRPMVIHVVIADLRHPDLRLVVTPGNPDSERSLQARTTTDFLEEFDVQVAVNGDGFTPWWSNSILDYYPHSGDPVAPLGFAASRGEIYSQGNGIAPTLYISRNKRARFNSAEGGIFNAISGNLMLLAAGKTLPEALQAEEGNIPQPRTAIALDKNGRRLIIVVVDGRQPNYSEGATLAELAEILIDQGAYFGMNLDGGGSSTLAAKSASGKALLLNSPIDHSIPGRERPVGNHLGIQVKADSGN